MEIQLNGLCVLLCLIIQISHHDAAGAISSYGCFSATDPKNITVSAGNYDPSTAGSGSCFETCDAMETYSYAAVTSDANNGNTYCFCAMGLQDVGNSIGPGNCTAFCADGQATCGTNDVYNTHAIPSITGVTVTSSVVTDSSNVMSVYDPGSTFTAVATSNGLGGLAYEWDFGTGAGRVKTGTASISKSYIMPGEYVLRGYATDSGYLSNAVSYALTVSVQSPAISVTWLCPSVAATFEEVCCNATIGAGTFLTAVVAFDNTNQETMGITDSTWFDAGSPVPEVTDASYSVAGSFLYILDSNEFSEDGNILFFEYLGSPVGNIKVVVLSPKCSGSDSYCYDTNTCSLTCVRPTCTSPSEVYSPAHLACVSSSTPASPPATNRYANKPGDLTITSVTTISITDISVSQRHDVSSSPIAVKKGDMLGWIQDVGFIAKRPATGQERGVFTYSMGIPSVNDNVPSASISAVRETDVHFIRAVASKPCLLLACHTFLTPKVYPVTVNISNSLLKNYTLESTDIDIVEGINASIIANPEYNTTGDSVVFTILPHTGSNITYEWHFGDGTSTTTYVPIATHAYASKGTYDVNVTASNSVSMKQNTSSILIEDRVLGLSLTTNLSGSTTVPHPFWLNMTSGSDYRCNWDFQDSQNDVTNETDVPLAGGQWTHVFSLEKCYVVTVTCTNDVSAATATATACTTAAIENLHLVKTGALVGQPISLDFAIDAGTNATFTVKFNGVLKAYTYDEVSKRGQVTLPTESSTGVFPVEIRGVNMVSDELFVGNFTIEEEITGASCSEGYYNGKVNDSLTFSCTIQGGTSIRILWNYTDGSPDEHVTQTLARWTPGNSESRTHMFYTPGIFNVCTTVSNNFNEFPFCMLVKIYNRIEGVSMNAMSPAGFSQGPESPEASFYFTCTAVHSPVDAWVATDWGDRGPIDNTSFSLTNWYSHRFPVKGTYTVKSTVCNLVDCANFTQTFQVMEIILNMQLFGDQHVSVSSPMKMCITLDAGDSVTLSCNFDYPLGSVQTMQRNATNPYMEDCFYHNYVSVGANTIQCTASNAVMNVTKEHVVNVQQPAVAECFEVVSTPPYVTHPSPGTFSLQLRDTAAPSCVAPTDAAMKVSWESDGCSSGLTTGQTQLVSPTTWSHTYSSTGEYSCSVCIWNAVSSVEISPPAKCGIYQGLSGMTVVPTYQPLIPLNSPDREGYTPSKTHFPIDRPVRFQISITGTVSTYSVAGIDVNATTITICEFCSDDQIKINFTSPGDHNVTITANSPLGSVSETLAITIVEVPVGLSMMTSAAVTAPDQPVTITATTDTTGTNACYDVDYGDGSERHLYGDSAAFCTALGLVGAYQGVWIGGMTLIHVYTESRLYTATVCGSNYVTNFPLCESVSFPVSSLGCDVPNITLIDQTKFFYQAVEKVKCETMLLRAVIVLAECENSLDNHKAWTVHKLNSTTGDVISTVSLSNVNNAKLIISGNTLDIGTYRFTLNVTLSAGSGTGSFSSTLRTFVRVVHCPLVASIVGGGVSYKEVGYNKTVSFTPLLHSYDPDLVLPEDRSLGITCSMRCRRWIASGEPWSQSNTPAVPYTTHQLETQNITDRGGCFKQGPGYVALSGACELTFNSANMRVNETYEFEMTISKGQRTSINKLRLGVVEGDPPCIALRCRQSRCEEVPEGLLLLNPSYALPLVASLDCDGSAMGLQYLWEVFWQGRGESWLPVYSLSKHVIDVSSAEISISSSLFKEKYDEYGDYHSFRVKCTAWRAGGTPGVTSITVSVNSPPTPGRCDVTPRTGTQAIDQMRVTCSGWTDDHAIHRASVIAVFDQGTPGVTPNNNVVTIAQPMLTSWTGLIPNGVNPSKGITASNVNIIVKVEDNHGGITSYDVGNVTISVLPDTKVQEISQKLQEEMTNFNKLTKEGNMEEARAMAIDLAVGADALYNSITATVYNCSSDDEICKAAEKKQKQDISDLALMTEGLLLGLVQVEIEDVQSSIDMLSAFNILLEHSEVITQDTQAKVLDKIQEIMAYLVTQQGAISEEEMQEILVPTLNLMESVVQATLDNIENPISEDKLRSCASRFYMFDNSIDAETSDLGEYTAEEQKGMLCDQAHGEKGKDQANRYIDTVLGTIRNISDMLIATATPGGGTSSTETENSVFTATVGSAEDIGNKKYPIGENSSLLFPPIDNCLNNTDNTTTFGMTTFNSKTNCLPTVTNANVGCGCLTVIFYVNKGQTDISNCTTPMVMSQPKCPPKVIAQTNNSSDNRTGRGEMAADGWQSFNVTRMPKLTLRLNLPVDQQWSVGTFELDPADRDVTFMVVSRCNGRARWNSDSQQWEYDYVTYLPNHNQSRPYSWMVANCYVPGGNVHIYSEIYQLNQTSYDAYKDSGQPAPYNMTTLFTTSLRLKNELAGCYYFDEVSVLWKATKVSTQMLQDPDSIVCESDHLTTFSSGMAVAPNAIDWAFVFANLDFFKNPTLYVTEILILVSYIAAVIWARRKDNKDIEKLGLTPLLDNKPEDKYLYEIFIATGHRRNAGTDSKVFFILSGDYDETEPRMVTGPGKKRLLQRGSTDGILLATNRPLGNLNYLRVWHDNSGKGNFTSWYLKHVMVQDLQTKNKYFFISNQWFAVEKEDGQVDRVVPVAGEEQMVEFAHLFAHTTQKNLGDDHLWYSVVARPPESRFTRVQRVSCCLLLLYTNMLANGMWYDRAKEGKGAAFTLGPFSLSMEQLYVGMMTNLIIFPVNFLVVQLFRKSPPRRKRKSRVKEALEAQQLGSDLITEEGGNTHRVRSAISPTPRSATGIELHTGPEDTYPPELVMDPKKLQAEPPHHQAKPSPEKEKKNKFQVPWWFRVVAWLLLWGGVIASAAIVTALGITFGDAKAKKWITSMLVSFATSIFLTQPLQVLLFAMLFSVIFKKPGLDREEAEQDEEKPPLQDNEEWVLPDPEYGYYLDTRPRQAAYRPPDPKLLEYAREQRLKELKMYDILREIVFYCIFLWLLLVMSYTLRPSIGFVLKDQVRTNFIDQGLSYNLSFMEDLKKVASHRQFWDWMNVTFLPGLVAGQWYNGDWIPVSRGFLADRANRIMGYATMRQLRVKRDTCDVLRDFQHLISECNEPYSVWKEDMDSYGTGWAPLSANVSAVEEYIYRTGSEIDSYPFWAKHGFYDGGGYVAALRGGLSKLATKANRLREERWIDKATRAIFLEFTTYNPGVNLFSIVTIVAEFLPSGGISPMYRVEPVQLLSNYGPMATFELVTQAMFGAFILFFFVKECRNIHRQGRQYFAEMWNWVESLIVLLSLAGTGIFIYRFILVQRLAATFKETHGNGYVKFQYVGYWQELLLYMVGLLVFLANIKFLKLLRFNRRMSMLGATLRFGAKSLMMFSIMFNVVFFAFVQVFYLIYFKNLNNFKTPVHALETCVQMMLGRFNFDAMYQASPNMGSIFFVIYIIVCAYILINMLISILNDSFTRVRNDISLQSNEHEMVDFILLRFKSMVGVKTASADGQPGEAPNGEDGITLDGEDGNNLPLSVEASIEHFPHKVDRLLNCISKVYFDRNKFDDIFETHGALGGAAGKEALKRMENKEEMRRVMARMMLTSFADPTNVKEVQRDYDMI